MGKSRKRVACVLLAGRATKKDRRFAHKRFRKASKRGILNERYLPYRLRELIDRWDFGWKCRIWKNPDPSWFRK